MENEALVDEMIALIAQIMEVAGPEWTMEALAGLLEAAQQGGGEQEPEVMSQGGPGAMPPQGRTVGKPRMM